MSRLFNVFLIGLSLVIISCNNSDNTSNDSSQKANKKAEVKIDSSAIEIVEEVTESKRPKIDITDLLSKADTIYNSPFNLDSNFVFDIENQNDGPSTLTNIEVQYLGYDMVKNQPTSWSGYNINTFIEIDSMKINGTYDDYVDSIDIGMMERSFAYVHSKILVNKNTFILLWSISFSTYEACPFSSGTVIFGTFFHGNLAYNTAVLGETSGGGDAPYWSEIFVSSDIQPTLIVTNQVSKNGGEEDENTGEEIIEKQNKSFKLKIVELGFEVIDN